MVLQMCEFVLHLVIYGILSDSNDLVHLVILSKLIFHPHTKAKHFDHVVALLSSSV